MTGFGQRNLFGDGDVEKLARFTVIMEQMRFWSLTFLREMPEHEQAIAKIREICAAS